MSKRILVLSAAVALSCLGAFAQDPEPDPTTRIAWIHELPGVADGRGLRVQIAGPIVNHPARKQLVITTMDGRLAALMRQGQTLPRLRIIEGKYRGQPETEYTLANVRVQSVNAPAMVFAYDRIEARMGVNLNPGPPPGASGGTMFIYGLGARVISVPVLGFDAPPAEGIVRVRLATNELPPPLSDLVSRGVFSGRLILTLPANGWFVEYKLSGGNVSFYERELTFRSPYIVIMTGR